MKLRSLFLSAAALIGLASGAMAQETLKVGGLFGTTGPQANFGVPYSQGLKLAVDEINARGGIKAGGKTYKVQLSLADTKSDPAQAVAEAQRMVADGVKIFFCCNLSGESVPVMQAIAPAGVMMLSPNAAIVQFLGKPDRDLLFRVGNVEVGPTGSTALWVPYVLEKYQPKTAAVITPSDEAGQIYADSYRQVLEAKGVKVVAVERYDHGTTDFTPQLTSIRQKNPDLIIAGYSDEVRGIFRQAVELGIKAKFAGTVGVSGSAGEGLPEFAYPAWTRFLGEQQKDPKVLAYMQALEKIGGKLTASSFWSVTQYDAMNMVAKSMEIAGTATDLKKVAEVMRNRVYPGMVDWQVDAKGLGAQSMEGVYMKGGAVAEVRSIPLPKN
jgi:branched-chain amino acid transport system substrate-binding protein